MIFGKTTALENAIGGWPYTGTALTTRLTTNETNTTTNSTSITEVKAAIGWPYADG